MISFKAGLGLCHNYDDSATALAIYLPLTGAAASLYFTIIYPKEENYVIPHPHIAMTIHLPI